MTNIGLYIATLNVYFGVFSFLFYRNEEVRGGGNIFDFVDPEVKKSIKRLFVSLVFLCLPVNINGNVFTVMGNAESEKSIYSVWSVYQKAKVNAVSLLGLSVYQKAGHDADVVIGLVGYQKAGDLSHVMLGVTGVQVGNLTHMDAGLSLYEKGTKRSSHLLGLVGYQNSNQTSETIAAMALYQRAGSVDRIFAVWSELKAPPAK